MTAEVNEPNVDYGTVLRDVWAGDEEAAADADCSPTKVCRNARDFTFEGIAEDGGDLGSAWKDLLKREGKLSTESAPSIRDLVLGESND
ncbi:MAG: hypothetical protein P8I99_01065 [Acidimicrobiales bacterium]|nr:hypothetical protein [Acidimicrobiales bacterium]MDG1875989.1 hypothetical protein [Acidimicrobiales bacterium]